MMDYITKNFAALSAIATGAASSCALAFTFAYLLEFDPTLIWVIESGDIIKFVIIIFALMPVVVAIFVVIALIIEHVFNKTNNIDKIRHNTIIIVTIAATIFAIIGAVDFFGKRFGVRIQESTVNMAMTVMLIAALTYAALSMLRAYREDPPLRKYLNIVLDLLVILSSCFWGGTICSELVKSTASLCTEVVLRPLQSGSAFGEESVLRDVSTVMILSHHSIFFNKSRIVVIPSGEIVRYYTVTEKCNRQLPK